MGVEVYFSSGVVFYPSVVVWRMVLLGWGLRFGFGGFGSVVFMIFAVSILWFGFLSSGVLVLGWHLSLCPWSV